MILYQGPIEVIPEYRVGQRVRISIRTAHSSYGEDATIVGVQVRCTLEWNDTLNKHNYDVVVDTQVLYTFLSNENIVYTQDTDKYIVDIIKLIEEDTDGH